MKKFFLALFCIWFSMNLSAQKIHFTDTSNVWYQFSDAYNDGNPPILSYGIHRFVRDTTIDSVDYVVFDFGVVREDTLLGKVYLRDFAKDSDVVLMDYNLHAGDSFAINGVTYVVSGTDSTLINGVWHKVWHFPSVSDAHGGNWPSDVIEGIGCIQHPTYMFWHGMGVEPIDPKEYCFSNHGITPPFSPGVRWFDNTTSCTTFPVLDVEHFERNKTVLYPNPATTSLTISAPDVVRTVVITNLMGQAMDGQQFNSQQVDVDVKELPVGVYFVRINGTGVKMFVKK